MKNRSAFVVAAVTAIFLAGDCIQAQTTTTTPNGGTVFQGANGGKAYSGPRVKAIQTPNGRTVVKTPRGFAAKGPNGAVAKGVNGSVGKSASGKAYAANKNRGVVTRNSSGTITTHPRP
jgi:hypothetical protein